MEREVRTRIAKRGLTDYIMTYGAAPLVRLHFKDAERAPEGSMPALFRKEMAASGTLIAASHNLCAAHGPSEIKRILKSYDHALDVIKDAVKKNDFAARLAGGGVEPGVR